MKITIICVGKVKEKFYRDAIDEFEKRLSKYCKFEIVEVADEKTPDRASAAEEEQIKEKEAGRILSKIKEDAYVCTLEIAGKRMTSPGFAEWIERLGVSGKSSIAFVIGGSLGIDERIKAMAKLKLSFSEMTFPHQLMRLILAEQIYRAFKINANESYHK